MLVNFLIVISYRTTQADQVKVHGRQNDLVERIKASTYFSPIHDEIDALLNPSSFIGRAPEQVTAFLANEVRPALLPYATELAGESTLSV